MKHIRRAGQNEMLLKKNNQKNTVNLSIIIPVYNEHKTIGQVMRSAAVALSHGFSKELIVVDDGSTDGSIFEIRKSARLIRKTSAARVRIIRLRKNFGKTHALRAGILRSTGEIVLIQDADLEYSPADYPVLLSPFITFHAHAVYGSRFVSHDPHRVMYNSHALANHFLTMLSNLCTNLNLTDMECGYKVFSGPLARMLAPMIHSRGFGFEVEITALLSRIEGLRLFEVGISYNGRTYAEGKKIGWKDGLYAVYAIIRWGLMARVFSARIVYNDDTARD